MQIVGYLKGKFGWKVPVLNERYLTGEINKDWKFDGLEWINIPIIKGTLIATDFYVSYRGAVSFDFIEEGTEHKYHSGLQGGYSLMKIANKGVIDGYFTFKKTGAIISIIPYEGDLDAGETNCSGK